MIKGLNRSIAVQHRYLFLVGVIFALLFCRPAIALPPHQMLIENGLHLRDQQFYQVVDIVDGDTLFLNTGEEVRLVGIQAPKLPLGRKGFTAWPLAAEAKQALTEITLGKQVQLYTGQTQIDRHGRVLAHILVVENDNDPVWVQRELLNRGLARVYSFSDNRDGVLPLLQVEQKARAATQGIWAVPYYHMLSAQNIANAVKSRTYFGNRFELVEGQVRDVSLFRDRAYVNFGDDWRDDFSLIIQQEDYKSFGQGRDAGEQFIESLKGRHIRVRGWTYLKNGPMMRITHKERIEFLD